MCKARVLPSWRHLHRCFPMFPFLFLSPIHHSPSLPLGFRAENETPKADESAGHVANWKPRARTQVEAVWFRNLFPQSFFPSLFHRLGPSKSGLFNLISFVWRTSNLADPMFRRKWKKYLHEVFAVSVGFEEIPQNGCPVAANRMLQRLFTMKCPCHL